MVGRGRGRWQPSPITIVVLTAAFALVGNLATNTVQVSGHWWRVAVWAGAGLLLALSLRVELVRHRGTTAANAVSGKGMPAARIVGTIPRLANHFQDRSRETDALRRALGRKGQTVLVALLGARGAGKTQLAAAYARLCDAHGYGLVAWINAESGPVTGLAELARRRGLGGADDAPEQLALAALHLLEGDDRSRQLVVFDNVEDPDALLGFLPGRGTTNVVITSSRQEFTAMPGITAVPVGMFTEPEGRRFLYEATGLPDGPDAVDVGVQLGWLPLGLAQAGAYIARNKLSYRQYAEALDRQDLDETLRRRAGADHLGVLRATQLSLAAVGREDPAGDAARLLAVMVVLSPDGVSRTFLIKGEQALGLTAGLGHTLDILVGWSMITLSGKLDGGDHGDAVVLSVHRLTARVIRHQASKDGASPTMADAMSAAVDLLQVIADDLPIAQVALRRAELDEFAGHILALRGYAPDSQELLLTQCNWAGNALRAAGDVSRAIPMLQGTLASRERVLGTDHPETLLSRNNLGYAYRAAGRLDEAITLHEETLAARERVLGTEHPDTLRSGDSLATSYQQAGRLDEAITLHEETLAARERVLGTDYPDTLESRGDLAGAYRAAGRFDEAITMHEENLAARERVLGTDHPYTLESRNGLAIAYRAAGRFDEAITMHEETLAARKRILGTNHPDTLRSRNNLGYAYQAGGRLVDAVNLFHIAVVERKRVLGPQSPHTLDTWSNLAGAYLAAGTLDEAITLYEATLAARERILGTDHLDTLESRSYLANAYRAAGRMDESIGLYKKVLADCERMLSPRHPLTTRVRANLTDAVKEWDGPN